MANPTVLDVLEAARRKITDPQNWSKGSYAALPDGSKASARSPRATCFCLFGALHSFVDTSFHGDWGRIANIEQRASLLVAECIFAKGPFHTLEGFNDDPKTTHADVLRVLDEVIATVKANPQ